MSDLSAILAFLRTDPQDAGCDDALALLHVYADLYAGDAQAAALAYPAVAAHLAVCGPCVEDLAGLLAAIAEP